MVDHQRGVVELRLHLGPLVVEHAQRVDLGAAAGVLVQVELVQERHQQLAVLGPAGGVAQRGEQQLEVGQPEVAEALHAQRDHLGVQRRVVDAERLHVHLGEVPVPAGLRALVAEHGADGPELHRQGAVVQPVLDERPHEPGGELRAQGHRAAAAVVEGVHLLRHDVGGLTHAAGEDGGVLEDRRLHVAVAPPAAVARSACRGRPGTAPSPAAGRRTCPWGARRSLKSAALRRRRPRPPPDTGLLARSRPTSSPGRGRAARRCRRPAAGRRRAARPASSHEPPGRSTRPTEPANSTSPASSRGPSPRSRENMTEPWVCPGACRTVSDAGQRAPRRRPGGDLRGVGQPHAGDQRGQRRPVPAHRVGQHAVVARGAGRRGCRSRRRPEHREGVVEVAVGEDDGDRLESVVGQHLGQRLDGVHAGVDDDALLPGAGGDGVAVGPNAPAGKERMSTRAGYAGCSTPPRRRQGSVQDRRLESPATRGIPHSRTPPRAPCRRETRPRSRPCRPTSSAARLPSATCSASSSAGPNWKQAPPQPADRASRGRRVVVGGAARSSPALHGDKRTTARLEGTAASDSPASTCEFTRRTPPRTRTSRTSARPRATCRPRPGEPGDEHQLRPG